MEIPVDHFARLARLSLSDEEKELFAKQIGRILEYVNKLNELDTGSADPTSHVIAMSNVMREDVPSVSLPREEALGNAPDHSDRFYRVPKIIE